MITQCLTPNDNMNIHSLCTHMIDIWTEVLITTGKREYNGKCTMYNERGILYKPDTHLASNS